jgi:hypothetical protein
MTNIKCRGGKEIDLLAINPKTLRKYHVEIRVATKRKIREEDGMFYYWKQSRDSMSRTGLDYFQRHKFEDKRVKEKIHEIFGDSEYVKVLVVSKTQEPIYPFIEKAWNQSRILIVLINDVIADLKEEAEIKGSRDDVMRFVELIALQERENQDAVVKIFKATLKDMGAKDMKPFKPYFEFMQIRKRSEVFERMKIVRKPSTQRLREINETGS